MFWPTLFAGAESYVMVMRGGGNMTADYTRVSNESLVTIRYERSPQAANRQQPGPGQGAWLDRPISAEEEGLLLRYSSKSNRVSSLTIKAGAIEIFRYDGDAGGKDLKYLFDAIQNGQLFYIHVTRAKLPWGTPFLKITRIGP